MNNQIQENASVGLHDCRITHITYEDQLLTLDFPEGIYVPTEQESERSAPAQMQCHIIDDGIDSISIFLFRETPSGKVIREDWSDRLFPMINDGDLEFEIVTTYRTYQHILLKGYVWCGRKPYHRECELELHTDRIDYSWG